MIPNVRSGILRGTTEVARHRVNGPGLTPKNGASMWSHDSAPRRTTYLYFLTSDAGHIKIGITRDLRSRLSALQSGNAETLLMDAVLAPADARGLERTLHARLDRHRMNGEWFSSAASPVVEVAFFLMANGMGDVAGHARSLLLAACSWDRSEA